MIGRLGAAVARVLVLLATLACAGCALIDDAASSCAPEESPVKDGHYDLPAPPAGYPVGIGWLIALDDTGLDGPSLVETDWMRLHAVVDGVDTVIAAEEFEALPEDRPHYGLYRRQPWFGGEYREPMPYSLAEGKLVIEPDLRPDVVFHWWTKRVVVPAGTSRVWFEARVRITGGAHVQAGIDYWRQLDSRSTGPVVNNVEAGASLWECAADQWLIVSVGKP